MTNELTVVIPTYNELDNIKYCVNALSKVLKDIKWEVIFVDDDSKDGTSAYVRELAQQNFQVRVIQRLKRRGLSSACVEGILASSAPYICVMDADLQHDETLLPGLLSIIRDKNLDLVIGSRYMESGGTGALAKSRVLISKLATVFGKVLIDNPVSDPMSGYFMLRRDFFEKVMRRLSGKGFKILLDILVSSGGAIKYKELPYIMRERKRGESKLDSLVILDFAGLIFDKLMGKVFPLKFMLFSIVGFSGVILHVLFLGLLHKLMGVEYLMALIISTYIAMISNFVLNNMITYYEIRLQGIYFIRGLFSFCMYCSFGALINISLAEKVFDLGLSWWIAGTLGAIAGAVWNYGVTAIFIWGRNTSSSS